MIDFTTLPKCNKAYSGGTGEKNSILYQNEPYMLKFPSTVNTEGKVSYNNTCITEYIGSNIFSMLGLDAQETILGTFEENGQKIAVIACKDFTSSNIVLFDFASLKNRVLPSPDNGHSMQLQDILRAIETQGYISKDILREHFWNMFIVDAFIGNFDRHNGNWGFLYNNQTDEMTIAPIYDCAKCLNPNANEARMKSIMEREGGFAARGYIFPTSAIECDGEKLNYFDFISSLENLDCNKALEKIAKRIDMNEIEKMIEKIPCISIIQKQFYINMLRWRKACIIDYSYNLLRNKILR